MNRREQSRAWLSGHWLAFALWLYTMAMGAWVAVARTRMPVDDGYYYLKIAQNVARGAGSTFDGINLTNGYHPLWMLCLTPVFHLTSLPDTALALAAMLQATFWSLAVVLVYYAARSSCGCFASGLAALLWAFVGTREVFTGLEFSLHGLGIAAIGLVYLRCLSANPRESSRIFAKYAVLGILCALTFLARLETILLAVILGLALLRRELQGGCTREGIERLFFFAAPIVLTALFYALINQSLFGRPFPVSGYVRSIWAQYWLTQDPVYQTQGWVAAKVNVLFSPLVYLARVFTTPPGLLIFPLYLSLGTFGLALLWLAGCACRKIGVQASLREPHAFAGMHEGRKARRRVARAACPQRASRPLHSRRLVSEQRSSRSNLRTATWGLLRKKTLAMTVGAEWLRRGFTFGRWVNQTLAPWSPFVLYSLLLFLIYILVYHGYATHYFAIQPWLAVLLAAALVDAIVKNVSRSSEAWLSFRGVAVATLLALGASVPLYTWRTLGLGTLQTIPHVPDEPRLDAAQWIAANTPEDAIIGSWNAGILAYYSNRRVVALDGLVNSWEYAETRQYDLCRYWREVGVTYLVDAFDGKQGLAPMPTLPYYAHCADRLELLWEDASRGAFWHMKAFRLHQ